MADNQKSQPTILIRKSDGTTERVTLDEFKRRKMMKTSVESVPKKASAVLPHPIPLLFESDIVHPKSVARPQTLPHAIPLVEESEVRTSARVMSTSSTTQAVATTTPVQHFFEHSSARFDHQSLLEEDVSEVATLRNTGESTHLGSGTAVFSSTVSIPPDLRSRAEALVLSWKKGVRDQHQFLEYALKSPRDGGLGLTEGEGRQLFADVTKNARVEPPKPVPPPRSRGLVSPSIPSSASARPSLAPRATPASVIQEVSRATPVSTIMGPVEEAASFSIEDLRRLSRDPHKASEMFLAKFSGWKDESYLLYLQARDSWRGSPLFRLYIDMTVDALERGVTVAAFLEGSGLSYDEYLALATLNHEIEMIG
jgi:hypothetical protein